MLFRCARRAGRRLERPMIADGVARRAWLSPQLRLLEARTRVGRSAALRREIRRGGRVRPSWGLAEDAMVSGLMAFVPDRAGFLDLARKGRLAFVYREVLADTDTPVSAFAKLGRGPYSFLLESVVGGDKWAAYSFAGVRPRAVVRARGTAVEILKPADDGSFRVAERVTAAEPLRFLDDYLAKLTPAGPPGLPRFFGGAVGWLGYDIARSFERLPSTKPDDLGLPELCFAITDTVVVFDNLRGTVKVVASVDVGDAPDVGRAYDDACARIEAVLDKLARPAPPLRPLDPALAAEAIAPNATVTREAFE